MPSNSSGTLQEQIRQERLQGHDFRFGIKFESLCPWIEDELSSGFDVFATNIETFARPRIAERPFDLYGPTLLSTELDYEINFGSSRTPVKGRPDGCG
jgi:hypothetical protein